MVEEFKIVLTKIKCRKAVSYDVIPLEVWKKKILMIYFLDYATQCINKTQ